MPAARMHAVAHPSPDSHVYPTTLTSSSMSDCLTVWLSAHARTYVTAELQPGMLLAEIQHRALAPIHDSGGWEEIATRIRDRKTTEDFVLGFKPAPPSN